MTEGPDRIPLAEPSITEREVELAAEAARTAWSGDRHIFNQRFERAVANYVDVQFAMSVPHGTAALHLALAALGIGPGDEVIVPDVTWISPAAAVVYVGADPILADIRPDTWCLDSTAVERAVSSRTKAIVGVDLYGTMCDWEALHEIANEHDLFLIEDAAGALGSKRSSRHAGAYGDAAVLSFHHSKPVTTGEGGMLLTNDERLWKRAQFLRNNGLERGNHDFLFTEFAFKYRMSAVQAALGVAQMGRIDELLSMKRHIFSWYQKRLSVLPGVMLNYESQEDVNNYGMVTAIIGREYGLNKFQIVSEFNRYNIETRPFFSPLSSLPVFDDRPHAKRYIGPNSIGRRVSESGINLPFGYKMTEDRVDHVCEIFKNIIRYRPPY